MPQNDQKQAKWEFVGHTIKTIILLGKLNSHFDATILQISLIFTEEKDLQAKYLLSGRCKCAYLDTLPRVV